MTQKNKGFTIVEMIVVVVVIGILAGLSAFGYRNWQQGLAQRTAQSDLRMAAAAMENEKNFGSGYPTSLPASFTANSSVTLTYVAGNASGYCLQATSAKYPSIVYSIESNVSKDPKTGACGSAYALGTPSPSLSGITTSSITVSWGAISGATGYVVKYGTSTPTTTASCTSSPCTISGLSSSTNYKVSVTANSPYTSKTSATVNGTTSAPPAVPPPAPTNLAGSVTEVGYYDTYNDYSRVTITWTSASPSQVAYYETSMGNVTNSVQGTKSATSGQIVYPAQTYGPLYQNFFVRAVAPDGTKSAAVSIDVQYN